MEFSHKPLSSWNPHYAGWDNRNITKNNVLKNIVPEHESKNFDFKVYPNPNSGNFKIEVQAKETFPYSLKIINPAGSLVYKIKELNVDKIEVNKSGLPSDVYYIRLNNGKSVITKKIISHESKKY
ncbi:MAG: T9SS type A sorting domain-containing protein [Bacteroidota bacterium]